MKKPLLLSAVVVALLSLSVLLFFVFSGPQSSLYVLDPDQVVSVTVWNHETDRQLSTEEAASVIEAYNGAAYGGKATGEGGTPDFGARILLKNGDTVSINEFFDKSEVFLNDLFGRGFYLKSSELHDTIKELANKQ